MPKFTVLYLEPVPPEVEAIVRARLPVEFELCVRLPDEPAAEAIVDADFVLVATTPLPPEVIAAARQLRLIQHQGVGYDKTNLEAAAAQGIPVATCPTGTSMGVAEHVFLLVLALYKLLLVADASLRRGAWSQWDLRPASYEISQKTFGILGLGRIGREVAIRARAFNADVIYYDIQRAPAALESALGLRFVSLVELLSESDILSVHINLMPETHHLINEETLGYMKSSAILINTARGSIVDEAALVRALRTGGIAGAGLDVFETEPIAADHPLFDLPNVVLTPHIAAGTKDALVAKIDACFANMLRVAHGDLPINVVNGVLE